MSRSSSKIANRGVKRIRGVWDPKLVTKALIGTPVLIFITTKDDNSIKINLGCV